MNITVEKLKETERGALANLLKMYCYEWSQYNLFDVDDKGVYPFEEYLHFYFELPRRYCYLARVDGRIAGFALIDDDFVLHKDYDYSMGEFFVMYKYRRSGVGKHLAKQLFDAHPGQWEVGFHPMNTASGKFWRAVISEYTGGNYTLTTDCPEMKFHDGNLGSLFSFDSRAAANPERKA